MANKTTANKKTKSTSVNPLDKEKAIVIYLSLAKRYKEHRENITCSVFMNAWKDMFECDKYNVSKESKQTIMQMQIASFAFVKCELDNKTLEEIKAYRDTYIIYPSREVPVELKQLAQSKGVVVMLAPNIDKHLSGFNVMIKEGYTTHQINKIPYGLSESDAKNLLESLPTKKDLINKESILMQAIQTCPVSKSLIKIVNNYKAPYATEKFRKFMNQFTIYNCTDKQLTNACVILCNRVGIKNLSNGSPIEYKFCAGSGKRKQSIKRVEGSKKANAKVVKNRKGKK